MRRTTIHPIPKVMDFLARVSNKLMKLPNEYVLFNDLLFENNGISTQINHIVVSPYGVFVIETKGYRGW